MKKNILMPNLAGQECTGCSICAAVCPTKSIEIKLTSEGFYEPTVNDDLCIDCGICRKSCYKYDDNINKSREDYLCYSAVNKNSLELQTSTSGGVSIELMRECLKQGYKVVGVAYDYDKDIAVTKIATKEDELEEFKGSKYFQSYTYDAFEEIIKDNTQQKYAIFGTPCQIYAMSKYLNYAKQKEKYLLVDIFCHGCPSINLWKKYLEWKKEKYNVDKFDKIEFRSKIYGWHEYAFKFQKDNEIYKSSKFNDAFHEMFFDKNTFNTACYKCQLRSAFMYTDIRIGDFWGHRYDDNKEGVSAVIVRSNMGKNIFNAISDTVLIKEEDIKDVIAWQSYGKEHLYRENSRRYALDLLSGKEDMNTVIKKYRKGYSLNKKIKRITKNIMKVLPTDIYLKIKKRAHKYMEV